MADKAQPVNRLMAAAKNFSRTAEQTEQAAETPLSSLVDDGTEQVTEKESACDTTDNTISGIIVAPTQVTMKRTARGSKDKPLDERIQERFDEILNRRDTVPFSVRLPPGINRMIDEEVARLKQEPRYGIRPASKNSIIVEALAERYKQQMRESEE